MTNSGSDNDDSDFSGGSFNQWTIEFIVPNRIQVSCMEHVDLFTDYENKFARGSREYEEPEKVLLSLQRLLILSG